MTIDNMGRLLTSDETTPLPLPSETPSKLERQENIKEVFVKRFEEEDIELQLKIGGKVFPRERFKLQFSEGPKFCIVNENYKQCRQAEITLDTSETSLKGQEK